MAFKILKPNYQGKKLDNYSLTNEIFIVNDKYFVKKSQTFCHKFLDLDNQINVNNLLKKQTFTIKILESFISDNHLGVVLPYYDNLTTLKNNLNQTTITKAAQLLKQLHATKNTKDIKLWNATEQLQHYQSLALTPKELLPLIADLKTWLATYQPEKYVLSHNDLIADNIVNDKDNGYLIDGDFAMRNDELFDIASFVSETLSKKADINLGYQLFAINEQQLVVINKGIIYQNIIGYHGASYLYKITKNKTYQIIAQNKISNLKI